MQRMQVLLRTFLRRLNITVLRGQKCTVHHTWNRTSYSAQYIVQFRVHLRVYVYYIVQCTCITSYSVRVLYRTVYSASYSEQYIVHCTVYRTVSFKIYSTLYSVQ